MPGSIQLIYYSTRRRFCLPGHWLCVDDSDITQYLEQIPSISTNQSDYIPERVLACQRVLENIPFVIPFDKRVRLFRNFIKHDQAQ